VVGALGAGAWGRGKGGFRMSGWRGLGEGRGGSTVAGGRVRGKPSGIGGSEDYFLLALGRRGCETSVWKPMGGLGGSSGGSMSWRMASA
jgi:hypothetical protein